MTLVGGRYAVERTLGGGGMAVVYLARDAELHRPVALKVLAEHLAADAGFRARFLREARLAARLSHPNVVAVYDAGEDAGRPYIVMELVDGDTLAGVLERRGRLPPDEVAAVGRQAAAGLGHAHAHGLVHRDVKPQNLLVRRDGVVKVADFGIARPAAATERLTQAGTILGTAAYLAPEQALGEDVTAAADLYSLGAVLYEALTGRPPFDARTVVQLAAAQQRAAVAPPGALAPGVPAALERVVLRCLARGPDDRPASAAELERLLAEAPAATVPLPPAPRARRRPRASRRVAAALVALAVLAAAAVAALLVSRGGPSRPAAPPPDRPNQPARQAHDLAAWLRAVSG